MQGFLNIYKDSGESSAKVVAHIKKLFRNKKVGHMGTLDPMACGVLPIAVGKATRMFDYFLDKVKSYRAIFTFGYETDTLDALGEIINTHERIPTLDEVKNSTDKFVGEIEQLPPQFSAKNVNGVRAYQLARMGKNVVLSTKKVQIIDFKCISQISENSFEFEITCGSGTYIRSLCRDLAYELGTFATMTFLERTNSGVFNIDSSIKAKELNNDNIEKYLIKIEDVFPKFPKVYVDNITATRLINGQTVFINFDATEKVFVFNDNKLIGLGLVSNKKIKLDVHLNE